MSVTGPKGFVASGMACGIKASGDPDLALVATDDARPVPAAAVFTSNLATAAPVQVSRAHLAATAGRAAAVILNSGNANAATGAAGRDHAVRMCALAAEGIGCATEDVLVCSTGLIGIPLPIDAIDRGAGGLVASLSAQGGNAAARAIMTTDTHDKQVLIHGDGFSVGGMAKGAAMLAPNMATMLAVLTTDADVTTTEAQAAVSAGVVDSFNAMTIDGCTSTNDTVILLCSGKAGRPADLGAFDAAVADACANLAGQMVGDAEGATKVVRINVTGAANDAEAATGARAVAESQLVKCSWYGCDPYWGRIVSELGSAGIAFDPDKVSVAYGGTVVCRGGVAHAHESDLVTAHMAGRELLVEADLGLGRGRGTVLTNDLTHAYIDENMGTS